MPGPYPIQPSLQGRSSAFYIWTCLFAAIFILAAFGVAAAQWEEPLQEKRIVKIGASARRALRDALMQDYRRLCPPGRESSRESCAPVRPLYTGENLPRNGSYVPLTPDLARKAGFVPPGTVYLRGGYTIYLVRWPDLRIRDSVSLWDEE